MSKRSWKRLRPDSNDELENALYEERKLTARWYERMSGQSPWEPGGKDRIYSLMEALAAKVNRLIQKSSVAQFASLPDE